MTAEVGAQDHAVAALGDDPIRQLLVGDDVRAAEAVDRLLGISHQEELAGHEPAVGAFREPLDDLSLHGIGVLELVDEDADVALAEQLQDVREFLRTE